MSLPATRVAIARLIPHQLSMCLWEEVLAVDALTVRCRTLGHRDPQHPLRRDGRLSGLHLVEYGAQLMAVHGALTGDAAGRPGVLAAVREAHLAVSALDALAAPLEGVAQRLVHNPEGSMYDCRVECAGRELLRARIAVMHPPG